MMTLKSRPIDAAARVQQPSTTLSLAPSREVRARREAPADDAVLLSGRRVQVVLSLGILRLC
eukprot:2814857-Rhodomonas_salina.3